MSVVQIMIKIWKLLSYHGDSCKINTLYKIQNNCSAVSRFAKIRQYKFLISNLK